MEAATETKIRLLAVETEEIYRYIYEHMPIGRSIELTSILPDLNIASIKNALSVHNPDVVLIGTNRLDGTVIEGLSQLRQEYPGLNMALLIWSYRAEDVDALRRLASIGRGGLAVFQRNSVARIEQLTRLIEATNYGQFIFDPYLANLMIADKDGPGLLRELTRREKEILSLLSKGYTNSAIGELLFIDCKTVEHHINNIYSKLKLAADFNKRHPRVTAAILYLQKALEPVS